VTERWVVAAGIGMCLGGVALVAVPGLSLGVPTLLAALLALVVLFIAVLVATTYLVNPERPSVSLPAPERRPRYRRSGDEFRELVDSVGLAGRRAVDADEETARERLHAELHGLAIAVLVRTTGCQPAEARDRLDSGAWTDDDRAAAFFTDGLTPPLSVRERLPVPATDPPLVRHTRHAVRELRRAVEGERDDPGHGEGPRQDPETMYWPTADLPAEHSTGRRRQVAVAVLIASGVGVFAGSPGLLLVGSFGIAIAATARFVSASPSLAVERTVSEMSPEPGSTVTVTVTVRNESDRTAADLRLLDGVPPGLIVVEDTPRCASALRPGRATTFSYTVKAVPGRHTFETPLVIASDFVGATESVEAVETATEMTLDCGFDCEDPPVPDVQSQVTVDPGRLSADTTGAGVEFDTVREYRPGDPPGRIDWRHRAKTGDLATVSFVEPRRPRVLLVVDARAAAYVADPDGIPAPQHAARGAFHFGNGLLADARPVGLTVLGGDAWLPPASGTKQHERLRRTLAGESVPWTPASESDASDAATRLTARLDPDTQVVLFSPLADDGIVDLCRRIDAAGHAVCVHSPDCTDAGTVEEAYGRLQRWRRLSELRGEDIRVEDWNPASPPEEVFANVSQ
jgi:uncharacterized repeat protein (TIGR01451 family)